MRWQTSQDKQRLHRFAEMADSVLAAYAPVDRNAHEKVIITLYGPVRFSIHGDWVHFWLCQWDAKYPAAWYGFDHWKQNFHPVVGPRGGINIPEARSALQVHIQRFYTDQGYGFPVLPETSALIRKNFLSHT